MSKIAYTPNAQAVRTFNLALDRSENAIRDMALALLGELIGAADLEEAKARQSAYVKAVREDRKARMSASVRKELFDRSEREVKAAYKAGELSPEAREAWSRYNMVSKRAGQIAKVRDAMFERADVREAVERFLASGGKSPTFFALEEMVRSVSEGGAGAGEAPEAKGEFTPEQFETMLRNMLTGARKAGFEAEALAIMVRMAKERSAALNK